MLITHEELKAADIVARNVSNKWKTVEYEDLKGQLNEHTEEIVYTSPLKVMLTNTLCVKHKRLQGKI
jgi:hypothetical protein